MFRFKQFTVRHDLCAMKVGTDGVLLGAWVDCPGTGTFLDVGTGSGLIALMLAQRSEAFIQALDVDEGACRQAIVNFDNSPFSDRLAIAQCAFQDYSAPVKYDRIVSNPPFFLNSLKSPDPARSRARHSDGLSFEALIGKSASLLASHGKLAIIVPFDAWPHIQAIASDQKLHLARKTAVRPQEKSPPKRLLLEYSPQICSVSEDELYIEKSRHVYSEAYIKLTQDFYLNL